MVAQQIYPLNLPLSLPLARGGIDRAAHLRSDDLALGELWERASAIHFDGEKFLMDSEGKLAYLSALQKEKLPREERYFLGVDEKSHPYFLYHSPGKMGDEESYKTLRESHLDDLQIGLAVHAQALALWHTRHPKCSLCGADTQPALGGSTRRCVVDATEHYPRTDPAIIVLTRDSTDRILLGRQAVWPEHRFSTFAGFVEPGESFEAAVHREVKEEANLVVTSVDYVGSQPWPFPASLMIAFTATIEDPENARPDGDEIVDIKWLSRDSIIEELKNETLLLPPPMSVARAMIEAWYVADGKNRPPLTGEGVWR